MGRKKASGNGEGCILTIRKDGRVVGYAAEITIGWADGKRKRIRRYAKTRPEAKTLLAELLDQHERGIDLTAKAQTVRVYVTEWIDTSFALHARPKSVSTYHTIAEQYIYPAVGDVLIKKLTTQHVKRMIANLIKARRSMKTINLARAVLRQALQEAVTDDLIDRNVAALVKPPKLGHSRADRALSPEQIAVFLEAARGERLEVALHLALFMGLRRGEVCGLHRDDLDLDAGTLTVNGTLQYLTGQGLLYGPPKTESGRRTLKLSARIRAMLTWHLRRLGAERRLMGDAWQDSPYLFVATTNGGPLNPDQLYQAFRRATARANVTGFRLHDLRHTCASLLAKNGYGPAATAAYLGHAHAGITLSTYTHLFPDAIDDAASQIERMLGLSTDLDRWEKEA